LFLKQFVGGSRPHVLGGNFDTRGMRKFGIRPAPAGYLLTAAIVNEVCGPQLRALQLSLLRVSPNARECPVFWRIRG
jgi:hypothetical protein